MRNMFGWTTFAAPLLLVAGAIATTSSRTIITAVAAVLTLTVKARTAAMGLVLAVCCLGLARRLLSPGRVDNDPLLILPVALLALAILKSKNARKPKAHNYPGPALQLVLATLVLFPLAGWALGADRDVVGLYTAGLFASCFAGILFVRQGLFPDIRDDLVRLAPVATLILAMYGLLQYFVLPAWDRTWMVASRLTSIGAPIPQQVRVFGTAESPGPFAMLLGALILMVLHGMWFRSGQSRVVSIAALAAAAPTLLLTGVRTGLAALALVFILAAIKTRQFGFIAVVTAVTFGLWQVGQVVLGTSSSALGNVFVSDRYRVAELSQDQSFRARLALLDQLKEGLGSGFGGGWGGARLDNLYVDATSSGGAIVGLLCAGVAVMVGLHALRADWRRPHGAFHLVAIYTLVFSLGGPILTTTSGLVVALVWGWTLLPQVDENARLRSATDDLPTDCHPATPPCEHVGDCAASLCPDPRSRDART